MTKNIVWYIKRFINEIRSRGTKKAILKTYHFLLKIIHKDKNYIIQSTRNIKFSPQKKINFKTRHNLFITVIVPNYNHAPFLKERLESIYNQTYQNFEVILLDDCSTDESRSILEEYKDKYKDKTKLVFNEKNSGSPFFQWKKGLQLASGDLVWIAESDDSCDSNFLESHVNNFIDESVLLSFSPSDFIVNGEKNGSSEDYISDIISPSILNKDFLISSHNFVNHLLGKKNIIINVSSCVIRNMDFSIFDKSKWTEFKLCGDWIFYLHVILGGRVAFSNSSRNKYRIHSKSTSLSVQKKLLYYKEYEKVACEIAKLYKVDKNTLYIHYSILKNRFLDEYGTQYNFSDYYDINTIKAAYFERKQNILMCTYSLTSGGGETFPITLANELKKRGYPITLYIFDSSIEESRMKKRLFPGIAIVRRELESPKDILDDFCIDIAHSHYAFVDETFARERMRRNDFRLVVTQHGMYEMLDNFPEETPSVLYGVDKWIYIAQKNIKPFIIKKLYNDKYFTKIYNAVEDETVKMADRSLYGIPENAFIFCIVSRGIPEKGWCEAIEAVTAARKLCSRDIHLVIVGDGVMYERLKDIKENFIHFVGFQYQVKTFLAMSDVGLLPSTFKGESVPLSILEAYSVGKPVLATNLGEIPYMIHDCENESGILIDLDQSGCIPIDKMAEAMAILATDKAYYEKLKENVSIVRKKFNFHAMVDKYIDVYKDVTIN